MGGRRRRWPDGINRIRPAPSAAPVVVPAGTVMPVTSLFRLKAKILHFAAHVEAPIPEHNHEALDLEKDPDPGMGSHPSDGSRYNRRRAGSAMVSLVMTNLKPAPSAPRFAATGLSSVMTRGGSNDAANIGYCPFSSKRLTTGHRHDDIVHRHVTEPWHSWR